MHIKSKSCRSNQLNILLLIKPFHKVQAYNYSFKIPTLFLSPSTFMHFTLYRQHNRKKKQLKWNEISKVVSEFVSDFRTHANK